MAPAAITITDQAPSRGSVQLWACLGTHIPDENGGFLVECPVIHGCISQGDTREEALANIREAIALCLENQAAEGWRLPESVEVTTVAV